MRLVQSIRESLIENPFAWILLAALVIAEYGNYQRGRELARVCELLGPHEIAVTVARTAREEIDNIYVSRQLADESEDANR